MKNTKQNPLLKKARRMMTLKEIKRHISPFQSVEWNKRAAGNRKRELSRFMKNAPKTLISKILGK